MTLASRGSRMARIAACSVSSRETAPHSAADSVQFYDMNFFLREDHARELADRMAVLNMRWWCEARVDIMARYSDATMRAIKKAG